MEISKLALENLGRFRAQEIALAPTTSVPSNVTVLIGNNGAGKTSILKSLATSLSWFVARLRSDKGAGSPIPEEVILNGAASAAVHVAILDHGVFFQWTLARSRPGKKAEHSSSLHDTARLADKYRTSLTADEHASLPLIAFYPVERVVLDIPLKIKEKHSFLQLDGYDNSLNQGVDFRRFFEWFREREDSENEAAVPDEVLEQLQKVIAHTRNEAIWKELQKINASAKDRQLTAVRTAIEMFMPGFSNLKVRRRPRLHMSIDKDGETLNVLQLSQGEKSLMALVGDIARRLAMMNPTLENPLHGDGIVLIDEVDMHLHPQWARTIIARLTSTFPNCQFVLTTHSPLVISDCKDVLVYALDNGELTPVPSQYGQDANTVLLDVMHTDIRNATINTRINDLRDLIEDGRLDAAQALLNELQAELPAQNLELAKARLLLRKEELRRAKNN
ncbi:AAA family ATPase [Aquitalea sp. USM4]|uniref:AAA family ATPase n=1 Tax=Aquitalea sp. USM4 TaxID=1590041 RepID=UPI00103F1EAE|nr:AAA family ATPase [Aquitalea sp. USM4]QBJ78382.1 ATP-binding protein [Aquitalea sp. USM4]